MIQGLGPYPIVSLKDARIKRDELRRDLDRFENKQ